MKRFFFTALILLFCTSIYGQNATGNGQNATGNSQVATGNSQVAKASGKPGAILERSDGSITFALDVVTAPESRFSYATSGDRLAKEIKIDHEDGKRLFEAPEYIVLHNSLTEKENQRAAEEGRFRECGEDVLFQMLLRAWSQHRPVVLSPDAIWLVISQGLSHYVNLNSVVARTTLVDHEGKKELRVQSNDLFSEQADWEGLISGFTSEIAKYTKNDIASTLVADFSTSGVTERIVSKITLMDVVKPYFDYTAFYIVCGIPSITLTGTPEDWRKVQQKTRALSAFGLEWWADELDPILEEFVNASEGKPDYWFWKDIVCKTRPRTIQGASCAKNPPPVTKVDGWFLKFFPFDGKGRTPDEVPVTKTMMSESVLVPFKYQVLSPDGDVLGETDMELVGGLMCVEEDSVSFSLSPKIGWFVRVDKSKYDAAVKALDGPMPAVSPDAVIENESAAEGGRSGGQDGGQTGGQNSYENFAGLSMESALVYWDEGPLTRKDFSTRNSDTHSCELLYGLATEATTIKRGNTTFRHTVGRVYMDPFRSWVKPGYFNETLLTNLQTSFDYVELCRRRAEKEYLGGSKFSAPAIYDFHLGVASDFIEKLKDETLNWQDTAATRFYAEQIKNELANLPEPDVTKDFLLYPRGFGEGIRIGVGSEFFTGTAADYFTPLTGLNLGFDLNFGRVDLLLDMLLAWGGRFRQDVPLDGYSWPAGQKQRGGNMDASLGYTVYDSRWFRLVPFVGAGVGFIDYPGNPGNKTDSDGERKRTDEIAGFRVQAGIASDFKFHRIVDLLWDSSTLSEFSIRTRLYAARTNYARVNLDGSTSGLPVWTINFGLSFNMLGWLNPRKTN